MNYHENSLPLEEQLRVAMRHWTSGIGIATASNNGVRHGMTVSSFTSVTVDPPMVLVSLQKDSRTHDLVLTSQAFGITLLAADQQELSDIFAGRLGDDESRFDGLETFTLKTGSPLLFGGLAVFDCRLKDTYDAKTTTVMFGEVVAVQISNRPEEELRPIVYHNQGYHWLEQD